MRVKKTKEDTARIIKFLKLMKTEWQTIEENGTGSIQTIFDEISSNIKESAGTMYLCFNCSEIVSRADLKIKKYYQYEGIWHNCGKRMTHNGLTIPTVGLFTRYLKVVKFLDSIDFF